MSELEIGESEKQIRDLKKELAEVRNDRAALRLQPCLGDSEIREKDGKLEELDTRAKTISKTIRDLETKRQKLMAQSLLKEISCF